MQQLSLIQQITAFIFLGGLSLTFLLSWWKRGKIALGNFVVTAVPGAVFAYLVFFVKLPFDTINSDAVQAIGLALLLAGFFISMVAFRHIGLVNSDDFWWSRKKEKERHLVTAGPYKYVRHPLALGLIISYTGLAVVFFHPIPFVVYVIAVAGFVITSFAEEKFIQGKFPEYEDYKKQTGMFIPKP